MILHFFHFLFLFEEMFGPRRRGYRRGYGRGGGGGGNFGLLLLGLQLFKFYQYLSTRNEFIPVTLLIMGINILMFIRPDIHGLLPALRHFKWPVPSHSCISVQSVYYQGDWTRVILAPFIHGDSWHLYYNMASFMWKSRTLERHYGTYYYAYLTSVFTLLTSIVYLLINFILAEMLDSWSYIQTCAVGYSGVIFALKVVTTHLEPPGMANIFGIPIPKRLAVWGELIIISVLFPKASFTGHLAGILVGVAFVSGPLKQIMDIPVTLFTTGFPANNIPPVVNTRPPSYTYSARPSGTRPSPSSSTHDHHHDNNYDSSSSDEPGLQEAIRRSMNDPGRSSTPPTETRPPPYNPEYSGSHGNSDDMHHDTEAIRNARLRKFAKS